MSWTFDVIFILPFVGAYYFYIKFDVTQVIANRTSGYHLFFQVAALAVLFFSVSFIIYYLIDYVLWYCNISRPIVSHYIFDYFNDLSYISLFSLALSVIIWRFLNRVFDAFEYAVELLESDEDALELIILKSQLDKKMIMFSTKSRKVYVGYIENYPVTSRPNRTIKFKPQISGYRDSETKTVTFTTEYITVYEKYWEIKESDKNNLPENIDIADFEIAIPIDEIVSATIFHEETYSLFYDKN